MTDHSNDNFQKPKRVPSPSFVKLAMKNMVRKGKQSIIHFSLTAISLVLFIMILAWFGRPTLPT